MPKSWRSYCVDCVERRPLESPSISQAPVIQFALTKGAFNRICRPEVVHNSCRGTDCCVRCRELGVIAAVATRRIAAREREGLSPRNLRARGKPRNGSPSFETKILRLPQQHVLSPIARCLIDPRPRCSCLEHGLPTSKVGVCQAVPMLRMVAPLHSGGDDASDDVQNSSASTFQYTQVFRTSVWIPRLGWAAVFSRSRSCG